MDEEDRGLGLLATLLRHSLELQTHLAMSAYSAGVMQPDTQAMIAKDLKLLGETLDEASEHDFPPDLALLLHATGALLQRPSDRGEPAG